jgi:plastocyanin
VLLFGLSSGNKLAIIIMAAIFTGFALLCSILIPRWRPQFPGKRLWLFVGICALLFLGMMTTVIVFGKESKAAGEEKTTSAAQTTTSAATTTAAPGVQKVDVSESEWKIVLPKTTLSAGKYEFDVSNKGKFPHDLTIKGPGVSAATPTFNAGQTAKLTVDLKPGSYDFYCSIPGHKAAGMDQKVTVS